MTRHIILASGSSIRANLLKNAEIPHEVIPARVDEDMIKQSMMAQNAPPRDIADKLAELKAKRIADKHPDALVLGCDQVLGFEDKIFDKPVSTENAINQLKALRGKQHSLFSAAVIFDAGKPIWRHVGQVRLTMNDISDSYLEAYVARNWESIRHSVGAYKLEEEGVRLFKRIEGDYFHVLGLPLLELIAYLNVRGILEQ